MSKPMPKPNVDLDARIFASLDGVIHVDDDSQTANEPSEHAVKKEKPNSASGSEDVKADAPAASAVKPEAEEKKAVPAVLPNKERSRSRPRGDHQL